MNKSPDRNNNLKINPDIADFNKTQTHFLQSFKNNPVKYNNNNYNVQNNNNVNILNSTIISDNYNLVNFKFLKIFYNYFIKFIFNVSRNYNNKAILI